MHAPILRGLVAAALMGALFQVEAAEPASSGCEPPEVGIEGLQDRAGMLARYERLPRACLHAIFDACTAQAGQSMLDLGSAAICSFGYEALLSQGFGGNFPALMAWWRSREPRVQ